MIDLRFPGADGMHYHQIRLVPERDEAGRPNEPGTEARNRCFIGHANRLIVEAARRLMAHDDLD